MSAEQLRRLAIGLVILLVVWAGVSFARRTAGDKVEAFRPVRVDRAAISEVVIAGPGDTVTLAKQGAAWTVNGFPVAADLVDQLLADLADTTVTGEVVAENRSSHERLGLDAAHAKRLTVRAGAKVLLTWLIGHRGSDYASVYLRKENEDRVYEVKSRLANAAERRVDDWRDKRILAVAADSVGGLDVRRGRKGYSVERAGSGWTLGGAPADSAAMSRWLSQLGSLQAPGFATPAQTEAADFGKPDRTLRIRGRKGEVLAALAFDSTAGAFLVRLEGKPTVFRLENWTADQITPVDTSLKARAKQ
jgi:hypothetical protein